jgi:hypothetical protein
MMDKIILGQDLGMGANKIFGANGGMQLQSIVSASAGDVITQSMGLRNQRPPLQITIDGVGYYVGPNAHDWGRPIENLDYERMTGVPETRAIVYANLTNYMRKYEAIHSPIEMIVGLPLEPLTGQHAQENINAVRAWMKGKHEWCVNDHNYQIDVTDVKVTSQPTGALFDYLLDNQGAFISQRTKHFRNEMGIISIGFNTLELLTVKNKSLVQSLSKGQTSGVRRLLELTNENNLYSLGELDSMLRHGHLKVNNALPIWTREILGHIEKTWDKRWQRFSQIILVGGGAVLLEHALKKRFNGKVFIPDDPILSISRGLYKLALSRSK